MRDVEVVDAARVVHRQPLEVQYGLVVHRGRWVTGKKAKVCYKSKIDNGS